jgi:hypothetical protein
MASSFPGTLASINVAAASWFTMRKKEVGLGGGKVANRNQLAGGEHVSDPRTGTTRAVARSVGCARAVTRQTTTWEDIETLHASLDSSGCYGRLVIPGFHFGGRGGGEVAGLPTIWQSHR